MMKQLLLDIQPPPSPSFENFKLGKNAEAVINIKEAIKGNALSSFIYLWGASGSGKTHLLTALGYTACERGYSVRYTRVVDMLNYLTAAQIN
ncbi:MAG: ATP-binding protein, partial [Methylophilus sp.]